MFNITEYMLLILGCITISLTFNLFLLPNNIASGGLPGLAIVLYNILKINTAYILWGINVPLFLLGIFLHGKNFGIKSILGFFSIPFFILLTQTIPTPNFNLLFAAVLGGIGTGIGLALIFKSKSTVGGFTLVAQLLHDYTKIKISRLIILLNATVILLAGLSFGYSGAFYAFSSLIITGLTMDAFNFIFK